MPAQNVAERQALRERLGAGADIRGGSAIIASRVGRGPYHSDDPVHHAAVDVEALRCEVHALAQARPNVVAIDFAARTLDIAADVLNDYAEAVGL